MMRWLRKPQQANPATVPAAEERLAFAAEIPGLFGKPLCAIQIEVVNTPQNEGSRWTLRGRLHTHMAALSGKQGDELPSPETGLSVQRLIGRVLDRRHQPAWLQRLSEPLLHLDFHTWLELHASTAPLARGARALMPESERLAALGVQTPAGDGPVARTWAGQSSGRGGFAQVSLLRFDKHHLPAALAALLGRQPLHVAGAIVNVVEESE